MTKIFVSAAVAALLCAAVSCNNAAAPARQPMADSTEVTFLSGDSVVYGLAGAEGTDSLLDLIVPGSDPQYFDITEARRRGNIIGTFRTGNMVAAVLSPDKRRVLKAVDLSSLVGRWIRERSLGDSLDEGFSLSSDGTAGTITSAHTAQHYVKWHIADANLVLTRRNLFRDDAPSANDTFDIVTRVADTLVLRPIHTRLTTKYVFTDLPDTIR